MRVGLCGGTFDPVHHGHVALVQAALQSGRLDRCIVMPAGRPPHKSELKVTPGLYRYMMTEKAFARMAQVTVSDLEMLQQGRSYTLDTIERLLPQLPRDVQLILVYGSDILLDLEKWYRPGDILARCPLLLARRGGYEQQEIDRTAERIRSKYGARIEFFDCPSIDLSSSQLREQISQGGSWQEQIPEPVARFIQKHGFYQNLADRDRISDPNWQLLLDLEQALWPWLNRHRLLHSLNVVLYSLHLALCHNLPQQPVVKAGLLHDCAKCLPAAEQQQLARQAGDPSLLQEDLAHAPAGMVMARERFNIADPEVLKAIFCHTTACPEMSALDQVIFLADKIEPARKYVRLEPIRELAETDLTAAMQLCLEEIFIFLQRENLTVHPYTLAARAALQQGTEAQEPDRLTDGS